MLSSGSVFPVFHYTEGDFQPILRKDNDNTSEFDKLIVQKWQEAEKNNVLRYKLNMNDCKRIGGNHQFLAQLNVDRVLNRRQPENIQSMNMPSNPDRFNFTKISDEEIFFDIDVGDGNNIIAANVSPIGFGHCLFLPHRFECLPQVATELSLRKTIELLLLSNSPYLRGVFNSLCANASVNHLHWHLYYLKHEMLLESMELLSVSNKLCIIEKKNYPAPGFCIKWSTFNNNVKSFANMAFKILNYLQKHEIAHNVYITRAKSLSSKNIDGLYDDMRIYIWPRQSVSGIKDTTGIHTASCELFGHLNIRNEEFYQQLTEIQVDKILTDTVSNVFDQVLKDIIDLTNE
ncbi:GDP-D-glucose phosphorylase 1 [Fopius arisanus]|uniref:GDP-D-glucose phosphorylase 1 n=1 Tax=Fopius arisanus TaxID=64838 RepID=A0A0C9R9F1_9HYME|nr:PREDICTED: GDP-D-glucose phosphorylase 1 [Fopius arisanus]